MARIRLPQHQEPDIRRDRLYTPAGDGGMDSYRNPWLLDYSAYQESGNAYTDEGGSIRKRYGLKRYYISQWSGDPSYVPAETHIRGIAMFSNDADYWYVLSAYGKYLFSHDLESPADTRKLAGDLNVTRSLVPMARYGRRTYFSDGQTGIRYVYQNTESPPFPVVADSTTAYSARHMAASYSSERLFIVNDGGGDGANEVRWSSAFDADDLTLSWDAENVFNPGTGEFTGLCEMGDRFLLFQNNQIYEINGTDPSTWTVTKVPSDGMGCVAGHTIKVINGVAVYLSPLGIAYYDGSRPKLISQPVKNYMPKEPDYWMECFAVLDGERYILFYSSDGGMAQGDPPGCDRALVWNWRLDRWDGQWTFDTRLQMGCEMLAAGDIPSSSGNPIPRFYVGSAADSGWTWQRSYSGTNPKYGDYKGGDVNIEYDLESRSFAGPLESLNQEQDVEVREVRVHYYSAGTQTVVLDVLAEGSETPITTLTAYVTQGEGVLKKAVRIPRRRRWSIRVRADSILDFHVHGFSLDHYAIDHG